MAGDVPRTGTHCIVSYRWISGDSLTPVDMYNVSAGQADPDQPFHQTAYSVAGIPFGTYGGLADVGIRWRRDMFRWRAKVKLRFIWSRLLARFEAESLSCSEQ